MAGMSFSAVAVSVTPLLVRVNSGKPHSASTPDTAWLTGGRRDVQPLRRGGKGTQLCYNA